MMMLVFPTMKNENLFCKTRYFYLKYKPKTKES